jgi:hypothetical protein
MNSEEPNHTKLINGSLNLDSYTSYRQENMDLYIHSPICLHGIVLN